MANIIDDIHRRIANRQIAIVPHSTNQKREAQFKVSDANSIPRLAQAPTMDKTSFRYIPKPKEDVRYPIFRFRITRDDGTILGPTLFSIHTGITVVQESKVNPGTYEPVAEAHGYDPSLDPDDASYWVHNSVTKLWEYSRGEDPYKIEFSYDLLTQIWILTYSSSWGFTPNNPYKIFWAFFHGEDSVQCMYIKSPKSNPAYPYKHVTSGHPEYVYKTADFYKDEYKIRPGFYEVRVPYYKETLVTNRTPSPDFPDAGGGWCGAAASLSYGPCNASKTQSKTLTVESSIDYTVNYNTYGVPLAAYYGIFKYFCAGIDCDDCTDEATANWYMSDWFQQEGNRFTPGGDFLNPTEGGSEGPISIPSWVNVISSNGDDSDNIYTNPVSSSETVTPTPYKVSTIPHSINAFYTGDDPYDLPRVCDEGTVYFPLSFEIFRLRYFVNATPKVT